jgi:type II secretory pathway component PulF
LSKIEPGAGPPIGIGQLMALNDEMAALVRAGLPLDRGLLAIGRDSRGRVGLLSRRLGERLEQGESLDAALDAEGRSVPSFYRSIVAAGLRSGRLSSALEGLAAYVRSVAETRRSIGLALIYPLMVLTLAYGLFFLFIMVVAPRFSDTFATFRFERIASLRLFGWLRDHPFLWVPVVPVFLLLLLAWWIATGRASSLRPGRLGGPLALVPGLRSVFAQAQAADFADLLALMIDNGVPLDTAVVISADAAGSPALKRSAARMAEGLRRGEPLADLTKAAPAIPPMLAWVLSTAGSVGSLSPALKHAAETYRQRSARRADAVKRSLPAVLLVVFGSIAVIGFTMSVIQPLITLWQDLAVPINE